MWVIFRDPKTVFNHLDKFVVELVEDGDILDYQAALLRNVGGRKYDIHLDVYFVQPLFTSKDDVEYYARKYTTWVG